MDLCGVRKGDLEFLQNMSLYLSGYILQKLLIWLVTHIIHVGCMKTFAIVLAVYCVTVKGWKCAIAFTLYKRWLTLWLANLLNLWVYILQLSLSFYILFTIHNKSINLWFQSRALPQIALSFVWGNKQIYRFSYKLMSPSKNLYKEN